MGQKVITVVAESVCVTLCLIMSMCICQNVNIIIFNFNSHYIEASHVLVVRELGSYVDRS